MKILEREFSTTQIQGNFSKVVWFYNLWSKLTEAEASKKVLELAEIKNGEQILEVAVGTGVLFEEIVKKNLNGVNEGIDISVSMLSFAKNRLTKYNANNYSLQEGSAYNLPYKDEKFDLIVSNYMFDLLPESDFLNILEEFSRVLKPSGRVVISTMAFGSKWYHRLWFYISKNFPALMTNCRPILLGGHIEKSGFENIQSFSISQNTFPSEVIKAERK